VAYIAFKSKSAAETAASAAEARENVANEVLQRAFKETGIVPVGHSPNTLAFDGTRLWVANYDDNTVQAINPVTGLLKLTVKVGVGPSALTFDGTRLWVANAMSNTVQAINPNTGAPQNPIRVGVNPTALVFDGELLWVANSGLDSSDDEQNATVLQAIRPATGKVDKPTFDISNLLDLDYDGNVKRCLAFDGERIWVDDGGGVMGIDLATGANNFQSVEENIRNPDVMTFDGERLWIAGRDNHYLYYVEALNTSTGAVDISLPYKTGLLGAMAFDGMLVWIADSELRTVTAIDPTTNQISVPILVGKTPSALVFDGTSLWVANKDDNTVQKIDWSPGILFSPISVGNRPGALAFDGTQLWVANKGDNTIQAINTLDGKVIDTLTLAYTPTYLALDGKRLWVTQDDNTQIQEINLATKEVDRSIVVESDFALRGLTFDGTLLWGIVNELEVQGINPNTGRIEETREVIYGHTLGFDGATMWVLHSIPTSVLGELASFDGNREISFSSLPEVMVIDKTRAWIVIDNAVQAIDLNTGKAIGKPILIDKGSHSLAVDGTRLWIANSDQNTLQYLLIRE